METKTCRVCQRAKPLTDFYAATYGKQSRRATCKACTRELAAPRRIVEVRRINLARYGLTIEQYDEMFAAQHGVCAACGLPEAVRSRNGSPFRLAVDHDHTTGEVRGLLCTVCNRVVGHLERRPELVASMVAYLQGTIKPHDGVGVPRCPVDGQWCSTCPIGGGNGSGGTCARQPCEQPVKHGFTGHRGPCGEVGHPSTPHVCTVGGEPLCTCPTMEQPHVRNMFTDCNTYLCPDCGGPVSVGDEHVCTGSRA